MEDEREFTDEVYEKIERALEDVKNGRVHPIEELDAKMKKNIHF